MPVDWNEADQDDSPKIDMHALKQTYRKLMGVILYVLKTRPERCVCCAEQGIRADAQVHREGHGGTEADSEQSASDATLGTCLPERSQCSTQYSHCCRYSFLSTTRFNATRIHTTNRMGFARRWPHQRIVSRRWLCVAVANQRSCRCQHVRRAGSKCRRGRYEGGHVGKRPDGFLRTHTARSDLYRRRQPSGDHVGVQGGRHSRAYQAFYGSYIPTW